MRLRSRSSARLLDKDARQFARDILPMHELPGDGKTGIGG